MQTEILDQICSLFLSSYPWHYNIHLSENLQYMYLKLVTKDISIRRFKKRCLPELVFLYIPLTLFRADFVSKSLA